MQRIAIITTSAITSLTILLNGRNAALTITTTLTSTTSITSITTAAAIHSRAAATPPLIIATKRANNTHANGPRAATATARRIAAV